MDNTAEAFRKSSCQGGRLDAEFRVIEGMRRRGVRITAHMFRSLVQGCIRENDVATGRKIYALLTENGLVAKTYLANSLIRLFASCGCLHEASEIFGKIARPSAHTWQAIVSGYANHGQSEQAIELYNKMHASGFKANDYIYVAVLKACTKQRALSEGRKIHAHILESELVLNVYVANSLLDMYLRCGGLDEAQEIFQQLTTKDVVSWNSMIAGYAQNGQGQKALQIFEDMLQAGVTPDRITYINTLSTCARIGCLDKGIEIHKLLSASSIQVDVVLGSTLVDMYAKTGCLDDACRVFQGLSAKNRVAWNAMISGCAQQGQGQKALQCFQQMQLEGVEPDVVTFLAMLKACGSIAAIELGKHFEIELARLGLASDLEIGNTLVDMYAKCGSLDDAGRVFSNLLARTLVSWNALIGGYAQEGHGLKALQAFWQMQYEGFSPGKVTYLSVLKACSSIGALEQGKHIHRQIVEQGLDSDSVVRNSLIDMNAKLGDMSEARELFDTSTGRDLVSWNALMAGYAQQGHCHQAVELFEQMQVNGIVPDKSTYMSILQACGRSEGLDQGRQAHAKLITMGMHLDVGLVSALVEMYIACGKVQEARQVFDQAPQRSLAAWNSMMDGFVNQGHQQEALCFFQRLQEEGLKPSKTTFVIILRACGAISNLHQGRQMHAQLRQYGFESDLAVGTALVDMYSKCGSLHQARMAFDALPERSAVTWNCVIGAYARHGLALQSLQLFQEMQHDGLKPTDVTLLLVLCACSHAGLVDDATKLFQSMSGKFGIEPGLLHYACMADLLGRANRIQDAENLILHMPLQPHVAMWRSVLAACQTHGCVDIARRCFEQIVKLDPEDAAAYDLMSNIYNAAGRCEDAADIRKTKALVTFTKSKPTCTWVYVGDALESFLAGDVTSSGLRETE